MTTSMEQLAEQFDAEEQICNELLAKRERARTPIGRAILDFRLRNHRHELAQITDEFDVITLHAPQDEAVMR